MQVKAVLIIDTSEKDPVNAIESKIETILSTGNSIRNYAFIYIRKDNLEAWKEVLD